MMVRIVRTFSEHVLVCALTFSQMFVKRTLGNNMKGLIGALEQDLSHHKLIVYRHQPKLIIIPRKIPNFNDPLCDYFYKYA